MQFKGLSRVFSNTTVQRHQFFSRGTFRIHVGITASHAEKEKMTETEGIPNQRERLPLRPQEKPRKGLSQVNPSFLAWAPVDQSQPRARRAE